MTKPKPKTPAPAPAPEPQAPKEPETTPAQKPEEPSECRYVAFCTGDGVCPYDVQKLLKKVRLQAIKDTLELIRMEKRDVPTIQIEEE